MDLPWVSMPPYCIVVVLGLPHGIPCDLIIKMCQFHLSCLPPFDQALIMFTSVVIKKHVPESIFYKNSNHIIKKKILKVS